MSVESSTESGTTGTRSRRARFREWRHHRPFAGGVMLCVAGLLIAYVPLQFAFELLLVGGSYTYIGLLWAVGVFLTGAFALYRPDLSTIFGVIGVVLSILSLLGALGGLLIGMLVGIVGGNLCVAWKRPDAAADGGGGAPGDERRPVRTDGGSRPAGSDPSSDAESTSRLAEMAAALAGAGPLSRLRSDGAVFGASPRGAYLDRVRRFVRRAARDSEESLLRAKSPAAPGRVFDAATSGGGSKRLAVTVAVLVVTSGTLTLVTVLPAAAILGDQEETTYTVDVGEIRLGDGGQICAASVGSDTYRVTITNATLVDATIYQQRGDGAVKTDFPSLQVDDTMVMYTSGGDEQLDLLATTVGCTEEDQTSRTVFRNRYQTSELLHGSEGVTMLNLEATGATVPEPGGFQFAAPEDENGTSPAPDVTNVTGVADGIDDIVDGALVDRLTNGSDGREPVGDAVEDVNGTVENATAGPDADDAVENATRATNATGDAVSSAEETVDNTTGEVTDADPPENVSGTVNGTTDAVDDTIGEVTDPTGEVTDTADEVTDTADEATGATDEATNGTGDVTNTTDDATDAVDDTTDAVDDTTDDVDDTTGSADDAATTTPIEETVTPTATADGSETLPDWIDQVDDEAAVLATVEVTEGDVDDVENVTTETRALSEEDVAADDNLTRLDNGTVLLLNGTDPAELDWAADTADGTDATSVGTETDDASDDGGATVESDDDGPLAWAAV